MNEKNEKSLDTLKRTRQVSPLFVSKRLTAHKNLKIFGTASGTVT